MGQTIGVHEPAQVHRQFRAAVRAGDADAARALLGDAHAPALLVGHDDQWPLRTAAARGHTALVRLLLSRDGVYAAARDNEALRKAATNGRAATLVALLESRAVDPSARHNEALRTACTRGFDDVCVALCADERLVIDAHERRRLARWARSWNHPRIAAALLPPTLRSARVRNRLLRTLAEISECADAKVAEASILNALHGAPDGAAAAQMCTMCYQRPRNVLPLPCSHFTACAECLASYLSAIDESRYDCATCHQPIQTVIRVF